MYLISIGFLYEMLPSEPKVGLWLFLNYLKSYGMPTGTFYIGFVNHDDSISFPY